MQKLKHYLLRLMEVSSRYLARVYPLLIFDKVYCSAKYKRIFNKALNLKNPHTFNEKIQWLKLYDRNPLHTQLADKYAVRDYVEKTIGDQYLNKLIDVWDSADEINFEKLPEKFVLKATHGCSWNIICEEKSQLDVNNTKKILSKWLSENFYNIKGEWVYKHIQPRIICEKYLEGDNQLGLVDYKYFCFNGKPMFVYAKTGHELTFYDMNWVRQQFSFFSYPPSKKVIPRPQCFDLMVSLAEKLSAEIPFCRVDFYNLGSQVIFGEVTFFPNSASLPFVPNEFDQIFGNLLQLPQKNYWKTS